MAITLLADLFCLNLADLKQQGYLTYRREGKWTGPHGELCLRVWLAQDEGEPVIDPDRGYLELRYEQYGQARYQRIELVRRPSNLGIGGGIWYVVCPVSQQRCRALYLGPTGFCGRQALDQARYEGQVLVKSERAFASRLRQIRQIDELMQLQKDWLFRPGIKRSYRGKLTRPMQRFLKLQAACQKAGS